MSGAFSGIEEVCIISTYYLQKMAGDVDEILYRLWKPHCLILVLDFPKNVMLSFPQKVKRIK